MIHSPPAFEGVMDIQIESIRHVIEEAGSDWDRRTHRFAVLAESAIHSGLARAWRSSRPSSPDALIFEGWVELARAQLAGRFRDPQSVVDNCYRAAALRPEDPTPWVVTLGVLRLTRGDHHDVARVWHEVVSRDPWHREAHLQMLRYLSPEECGSQMKLLDFVDAAGAAMPACVPAVGLELTAAVDHHHRIVVRGGINALLARQYWTYPRTAELLNRVFREWTGPDRLTHSAALADLNTLSYALVRASRLREAGKVFELISGTVTAWPWKLEGDPVEAFNHWQSRAGRA
ncbi:tetratricopeptide repeat protein [Kitasatospora aureofaciens]|uniref:tetratricopeptide repeat protein n=1 Tax=Kitasatospora aureofaciens TaxID=1894 RepID=UPI0036F4AB12